MASEKILSAKKQTVAELTEKLKNAAAGILVDYKGISVANDTALRREMREAGVEYSVVKNTLTKFAAKEVGLDGLADVLEGTTALAVHNEDVIASARILVKYAETHENFKVKAGFVEGKVLPLEDIISLAKTPSKETLLTQLVFTLSAPIKNLAVVINQIAEKQEA